VYLNLKENMATAPVIKEEVKVTPAVVIAPPPVVEAPKVEPVKLTPDERVPSNWHITVAEEGLPVLHCVNNTTGKVFKGTNKEFSALLKG